MLQASWATIHSILVNGRHGRVVSASVASIVAAEMSFRYASQDSGLQDVFGNVHSLQLCQWVCPAVMGDSPLIWSGNRILADAASFLDHSPLTLGCQCRSSSARQVDLATDIAAVSGSVPTTGDSPFLLLFTIVAIKLSASAFSFGFAV